MQKLIIWTLAVVMILGAFTSPLRAMEPVRLATQETELVANRRGGRRPQPPRRTRNNRRHNNRRHGSSGWGIAGAIIGGIIASGIAHSSRPAQPVLVCDSYGNCRYVYR